MVLITYRGETEEGTEIWGYSVNESAQEFIESTQEYEDEINYLVNVLEITDEQAKKYDGTLKGM